MGLILFSVALLKSGGKTFENDQYYSHVYVYRRILTETKLSGDLSLQYLHLKKLTCICEKWQKHDQLPWKKHTRHAMDIPVLNYDGN